MAWKRLKEPQKMSNPFSRRAWLKSATLAAGAACVTRPVFANGDAMPKGKSSHGFTNLSINENQFGPSPAAIEAIRENAVYAHEYPLESQETLRNLIAKRERVEPEQVILGAGSSDITMGASAYFAKAGGNMVSSEPTFNIVMAWAAKYGIEHIKSPWTKDYGVDLASIEKSITDETTLAYVCNPENPVGTILPQDELKAFCQRVSKRCPVLVDEAYIDYAGDVDQLTMMDCVREGLPVIVLRTFSKALGLGGMRIGYAVTTPELAESLSNYYVTGIGCGCSHTSLEAAIAAYKDTEWTQKVREQTAQSRQFLCDYFERKGLFYIPSKTTFVLAPTEKSSKGIADAIFGAFKIKTSPRNYFEQDYLRISMGTLPQMERLTQALDYVL